MAISEHDQQVLQELEKSLRVADPRSSLPPARRRTLGLLIGSIGLMIGLLVVFFGLRLAGAIGTWVGVAGSLVLVASAWVVVDKAASRPAARMASRRDVHRS